MKRFSLALVVAALGALLGWTLGARGVPRGGHAPQTEEPPPPRPSVEPEDARSPPPPSPADSGEAPTLGEILARDFPARKRTGSGTIRGTVMGSGGEPEDGVELRAEPVLPPPGPSIRERIRHHRQFEALLRTTRAGSDGSFVFERIPEGVAYRIRGPTREVRDRAGPPREVVAGDVAELVIYGGWPLIGEREPPSVMVHVTLGGKEVPRAELVTQNADRPEGGVYLGASSSREWSSDEPKLSLWIGEYRARAFLDGEYASNVVPFDPERVDRIDLALEPCSSVFGRVETPPTSEYPQLFMLPLTAGDAAAVDLKAKGQKVALASGGFRLIGIEPGRYLFGLTLGQSPILRSWEIEVREGMNTATLSLGEIPEDDAITITVLDPQGLPFEGIEYFRISTGLVRGTRSYSEKPISVHGNRYRVRLGADEIEALQNGRKVVVAVVDRGRWESQEVQLVPGQYAYTLAYPPQAELEILLPDYLGSGHEGALDVTVFEASGGARVPRSSYTEHPQPDFLGRCRFRNLKPGPNVVLLEHTALEPEGGAHRSIEWARRVVDLSPGPNRLEIPVPRLFHLAVGFPKKLHGERLRISQVDARGTSHDPEDARTIDGIEEFRLPAGVYSIYVARERMTFRLESDHELSFLETRFSLMEVGHPRREGSLSDLGLQPGDIVDTIDGAPYSEPDPASFVWRRLTENGRVRLGVRRDQARAEVTLDERRVANRWNLPLHGVLEPRKK